MAKGEKTVNPATAHLKSQKAAALKKSKAAVQAQRSERLATRNPERLQRRADELKQVRDAQGGVLPGKEKQELERLEKEVAAIWKARGEEGGGRGGSDGGSGRGGRGSDGRGRGNDRGRGRGDGRGGGMLGKRRRDNDFDDEHDHHSESSDTDPEVRSIPMPRDTPPPIPPRRHKHNPNTEPIANPRMPHALPSKPPAAVPVQAQTTYSSAPQIRDLRKEATAKFIPSVVSSKLRKIPNAAGGKGGDGVLLEPEEVDRLEQAGYMGQKEAHRVTETTGEDIQDNEEDEDERFEREMRELEEESRRTEQDMRAANAATAVRHELRDAGRRDAEHAADAAEEEAGYNMLADAAEEEESEDDLMNLQIPSKNQRAAAPLMEEGMRDAERAAAEAEKEAEYSMMADAAASGKRLDDIAPQQAERRLRLVEIEDVDDDEW